MKVLDLFGAGVQSYSAIVTSQRRLNCFYDLRPDGDKNNVIVVGTPGLQLAFALIPSPIRGMHVAGTTLYIVAGAGVFAVNASLVSTFVGTLGTAIGKVGMEDDGVSLIIVDGVAGYTVNIVTNVLTTIVDANFPSGATTVAFLNGRMIVEKAGTRQFYLSQSYTASSWTPVIFGTKENKSDILKAVSVFNGLLILWGAASMEFWQADASTSLTVSRINGATQAWGLAAVNSRAIVNNAEFFLGVRPEGGYQIAQLDGYKPTPVSTSDIDAIINGFTTVSDAVALTYVIYGHPMYQLTFPSAGRSFLYDTVSRIWSEVQTGLALVARHIAELSVTFNNVTYVSDNSSGNVYTLNPMSYTDNGVPIKRQVRSKHVQNGGNNINITDLYLDMETGVGLQNGQGSDPLLMVQTSKDGGRTFGYERTARIGSVGQYLSRVILRRFGRARDFVFQFTMTDPVQFVLSRGAAKISGVEGSDG